MKIKTSIIRFAIQFYNKIPLSVLNFFAPIYNVLPDNIRLTRIFSKEWKELERQSQLSEDERKKEQLERLQFIINYSYEHVVYYKKLFDENGIKPNDIRSIEDLNKIPLLTKKQIIENQDELISDEYKKSDLIHISTSGTTGVPVDLYVERDSHIRDWAYMYYMFKDYGLTPKSKKLILRGKTFKEQNRGKLFQWDAFKRELSLNIFCMNDRSMEIYCNAIEKYRPDFVHGYMSAMYVLCKYIENRKEKITHKFKGFISISENISNEQREYVEKIIDAPVLSFYGMSERVIWATERYIDKLYEVDSRYGIAEIIDSNSNCIYDVGRSGEIVGTGLFNKGMPLIRYRTGDIGSWNERDILNPIEGRWKHDQIVAKDGSFISMTALNMHSEVFKHVMRYQLYQDTVGEVVIKILPLKSYSTADSKEILKQFKAKTDNNIIYKICVVSEIEPNKNGKLLLVDQRLILREKK